MLAGLLYWKSISYNLVDNAIWPSCWAKPVKLMMRPSCSSVHWFKSWHIHSYADVGSVHGPHNALATLTSLEAPARGQAAMHGIFP